MKNKKTLDTIFYLFFILIDSIIFVKNYNTQKLLIFEKMLDIFASLLLVYIGKI